MAARTHHHFLLLTLILIFLVQPNPSLASRPLAAPDTGVQFIKRSCSSTTYPDLCFSSLISHAGSIAGSPTLLARTALSVSLDSARSASTAMRSTQSAAGGGHPMSPREKGALSDCMDNVSDSIDELRDSLGAMGNLRGKDIGFQIDGVQTWVSAALTDDNTCMDGFAGKAMEGSGVRSAVRGRVAGVAHLTSNALALINALASTIQVSGKSP